jgi:hypothetical protein
MADTKTKPTGASIDSYLASRASPDQLTDCRALMAICERVTKEQPKMWGPSIVGFGSQHYEYASGRQGDWFVLGFSPRKQNLTLYFMSGFDTFLADQLAKLGKHKTSKACLYINRLSDVDTGVLEETVRKGFIEAKQKLT